MALKLWTALLTLLLLAWPACAPRDHAQAAPGPLDARYSDVVLVIDHSGSMEQNDPAYLRLAAAKLFIDLADPSDKIGIVVMSDSRRARALTPALTPVKNRVAKLKGMIDGLRNEPMGEETHMGTALAQAYALLDSATEAGGANHHQFVVLLSDGLPTGGGQAELVAQMAGRFHERRYWKIFAIALGAAADPGYLQRAVADPSGGAVHVASRDSDLLDSYLDVYARAGDDRFIDRVTVAPNTLAPLVEVLPDQQPTQLSVVLVRGATGAHIASLQTPNQADVVQPFYQNTVRRGAAPEYELYSVPLGAQVGLAGPWLINVEQADPAPVTVVVLSRSRLRMWLAAPAPLLREDDASLRYHPLGRPLLLVAGADIAAQNESSQRDQPYVYRHVTGMAPLAHMVGQGQPLVLTDDGGAYDAARNDGRYTGLHPPLMAPGDYQLQLEVPQQTDGPTHLRKTYVIRVAAMPTMTLTLPPAATTLPINMPFSGLIDLPGWADFQIESVTFTTAFIRRPDGGLDRLTVEPREPGRFHFTYTPSFAGPYRLSLIAAVQGRGPIGEVHYIDYAEASVAVPEAVPLVAVSPAFTTTLAYDRRGTLAIPLRISSHSLHQERLTVQVEGLAGSQVLPAELLLQPAEAGQRTISVYLPEDQRPQSGQLTLVVGSPEQRVLLQGSRTTVPFRAPGGSRLLLPLALLATAAVGWFVHRRRRRQRARAMLGTGAPRRLL